MSVVQVEDLVRVFTRPIKEPGLRGLWKFYVRPRYQRVEALRGVSFTLEEGEILGYVGPNGAGKTTTLRILSGVLHPTRGRVEVLGHQPWKREDAFLRQIAFVTGHSGFLQDMVWDLTPLDGFRLLKDLYGLSPEEYRRNLESLLAALDLEEVLQVPVRRLSLGQRVRAELVAALLHRPRVLLLDEPTLGLDLVSQHRLRRFLRDYVARTGTAVILTSHYMRDVEELAHRLLVLHQGRVVFTGTPAQLAQAWFPLRTLRVVFAQPVDPADLPAPFQSLAPLSARATVPPEQVPSLVAEVLHRWPVRDLTVEEPDLETVLRRFFAHQEAQEPPEETP